MATTAIRQRVRKNNNMQHAINKGKEIAFRKGYTKVWDINQCIISEIENVCRVSNRDIESSNDLAYLIEQGYQMSLAQMDNES